MAKTLNESDLCCGRLPDRFTARTLLTSVLYGFVQFLDEFYANATNFTTIVSMHALLKYVFITNLTFDATMWPIVRAPDDR
jgi:hypothetical protein